MKVNSFTPKLLHFRKKLDAWKKKNSLALLDYRTTSSLSFRPLPTLYTDRNVPAPLLYPGGLLKFLPWKLCFLQNFVYGKRINKQFTYPDFNRQSFKLCYWLHGLL